MNPADWPADWQIETLQQQASSDLWGTLAWGFIVVVLVIIAIRQRTNAKDRSL